jgi:cytochrome c553
MIESRFSIALASAIAALALTFASVASAEDAAKPTGSAEAGAAKAAVCAACHGPNGNSTNPEWPVLAGQNAAYIQEQLSMIKEKKRNVPVMFPIVEPLSEQDFADLAAYFSTLR